MPFCSACGTEVGPEAAYCWKCGRPITTAPPANSEPTPKTGLRENVAALLAYVLGWVTGLLFFLIDKRPFVRFHAVQSMIAFGALFLLHYVFARGAWAAGTFGYALMDLIAGIIGLVALVCWILCMVKAYQGHRFKLPVVGDMAENYSK